MHRICLTAIVTLCLISGAEAQLVPNLGGQRAGISAFQSLKLGIGARGTAMGESFVAVVNDVSSLYWNPASLVEMKDNQVIASHTEYVIDIKHEFFGVGYRLNDQSSLGLAFSSLHMDDMEITTETQPFGTGRYFTFGDITMAVTYSMKMTDQFSFGTTVRYARETLGPVKMHSVMVDLGTLYWTGLGSARFAVAISNFGADVAPTGSLTQSNGVEATSFQSFSLPTVFRLGFAMEAFEDEHSRITTSLQLNHPNDNAENFRLGAEYAFQNTFFVRAGVKRTIGQPLFGADETSSEDVSLGAGFAVTIPSLSKINADYAFSRFSELGSIHRFSLAFTY